MNFSNRNRAKTIQSLKSNQFDVIIIGGGITGAGIALDAVARGMKVALVEMQDFAAGTSSRSTKLVHGGLRYLKQFQIKQVAEIGKERAIVYENGPHVTTPEWMLLPFHKGGTYGKMMTSIGLSVYDILAGVKRKERRKMLTAEQTLIKSPIVKQQGLKGGGIYVEYRTDDARLTLEVMKKAVTKGAVALNYSKVDGLIYEEGKVTGVSVTDQLTGKDYNIYAEKVVNATGPWVDDIREKDHSKKGKVLKLTKGAHIVLDQQKFPLKQAVYFDTPDGRMIFAIPRDGKAYVGTTDTFYESDPIEPKMTTEDRDYLLKAIHYMFPTVKVTKDDVESSWAGVRPLIWEEGKDPSEISRKDEIWESASGLLTIAGGKLTGYREMAEKIVDTIALKFKEEKQLLFSSCTTKHIKISGGDVGGSAKFNEYKQEQISIGVSIGLSEDEADELVRIYGSNTPVLFRLIQMKSKEMESSKLPTTLFAKLLYALEYEMTVTPLDFFNRRTSMILFDIGNVYKYKDRVITYMETYFDWENDEKELYELELVKAIEDAAFLN